MTTVILMIRMSSFMILLSQIEAIIPKMKPSRGPPIESAQKLKRTPEADEVSPLVS